MKKRLISLLLLAIVLTAAPLAFADHCRKCNSAGTRCAIAVNGGYPFCDDTSGSCVFSGTWCTGPHPFVDTEEPLLADFVVASVERLDEAPQPQSSEPRLAAAEPQQQPATR
ncbi:MAG TPA: hypothetical protein VHW00_14390 [Thermoanaerobaculia bacterium]|nr:hypothetical protein [Thermoanaerobaculia bacterium]